MGAQLEPKFFIGSVVVAVKPAPRPRSPLACILSASFSPALLRSHLVSSPAVGVVVERNAVPDRFQKLSTALTQLASLPGFAL